MPASESRMGLPLQLSAVAVVCLLFGNMMSLAFNLGELGESSERVGQSWNVIAMLDRNLRTVVDAETGQRGYLLTGNSEFLEPYREAVDRVAAEQHELAGLVARNQVQSERAVRVGDVVDKLMRQLSLELSIYEAQGATAAVTVTRRGYGKSLMDDLRRLLETMRANELDRLSMRHGRSFATHRITVIMAVVINASAAITLLVMFELLQRTLAKSAAAERGLQESKANLEYLVEMRTAQLSHLSRYLLVISEAEKSSLAAELHDELGANLTAIGLDIGSVADRLRPTAPDLEQRLRRALKTLRETVAIKRRIIHNLRPSTLDTLGIGIALHSHCEEFTERTNLPCLVEVGDDVGQLPPQHSIAFFRIAQEALNNIAKYAHARNVWIELKREGDDVCLRIIDDGVGIEPDSTTRPRSHGIIGMRERVAELHGRFSIQRGADDVGTVIEAYVPLRTLG